MKTILFVDNEPTMGIALKLTFRKVEDFDIVFVTDISEAYQVLKSLYIDAVVSDYNIGDASGIEFLSQVRKSSPKIKTALMTGENINKLKTECELAQIDHIFEKAMLNKTIVGALRNILGNIHDK